ncbi:hypothetical protein F3K52_19665 [Pseudomonas lactis]|nr:hypothetical protein F3K52_19665 [Pseudomonas lactis]
MNDNAPILNERVVCGFFTSKLAPTTVEVSGIKKGPCIARPFSGSIVSTLRPHRLRHAEHE